MANRNAGGYMTFDELAKIPNPEEYPFQRTKQVARDYERKLKLLSMAGVSPDQHILNRWNGLDDCMFIDNEFPYDFEDCNHQILWWRNTLDVTPMQAVKATPFLFKALTSLAGKDYVVFRSQPKNQSVKGLLKYHVISRR